MFSYIILISYLDFFLDFIHLRKLRCLIRCDQTVDNLIQITVHNRINLIQRQLDSVVGHTALWEVVGTDLLGTVSGTDLAAAFFCFGILAFFQL